MDNNNQSSCACSYPGAWYCIISSTGRAASSPPKLCGVKHQPSARPFSIFDAESYQQLKTSPRNFISMLLHIKTYSPLSLNCKVILALHSLAIKKLHLFCSTGNIFSRHFFLSFICQVVWMTKMIMFEGRHHTVGQIIHFKRKPNSNCEYTHRMRHWGELNHWSSLLCIIWARWKQEQQKLWKFYVQLGHDFAFSLKREASITGLDMVLLGNTMLPLWSLFNSGLPKKTLCFNNINIRRKG